MIDETDRDLNRRIFDDKVDAIRNQIRSQDRLLIGSSAIVGINLLLGIFLGDPGNIVIATVCGALNGYCASRTNDVEITVEIAIALRSIAETVEEWCGEIRARARIVSSIFEEDKA
jgi:hypothetical protein